MEIEIDWIGKVIPNARTRAEEYYTEHNIATTLRGLFYILVSDNILPNTQTVYRGLSKRLAKLRYKGSFPAYLIRDVTRAREVLEHYEFYPTESLSEEDLKEKLEEIINEHVDVNINPWEDQPKRVLVLIEKEAQFSLVTKIIRDSWKHGILEVCFSRGYNSATDMIRLARRIEESNDEDKHVVLLIVTDFDPSGEDIARDYRERLLKINENLDFSCTKVAVTLDQIKKYNLPSMPETSEERAKILRDPRYRKFGKKYGLMRVELDALVALRYKEFEETLIQKIKEYFDEGIYNSVTVPRMEELKNKAEDYKDQSYDNLRKLLK